MKKTIYTMLLLGFIILYGCISRSVTKFEGTYEDHWHDTNHRLSLFEDGSFTFIIREGLHYDTLNSTWSLNGNRLILKSIERIPKYSISAIDTCKTINISAYDLLSKERIPVYYKGYYNNVIQTEGLADIDGKTKILSNLDSLYFECIGYKSFGLKVDNNKCIIEVFLPKVEDNQFIKQDWFIDNKKIKNSNGLILNKK